jgi:DNA-binding transcriptional MocR family regulator
MFELTRTSTLPLVDQIVERIGKLIQHGQLAEGTRLPSIRKLAKQVGASPFTVVDAYDRLVARGLIESRAGRGFFVSRRKPSMLAVIEVMPDPGANALSLARAALTRSSDVIPAGSGFLPESWFLEISPNAIMTRLTRGKRPQVWGPCPPQGLGELREHVAAKLVQQGIAVSAANIVTSSGATQAFDLICRHLLAPGDAVLVEDPGYFVLFAQLRSHHVRLIPIPRRSDGPDIEALEAACRAHRPRAFFMQTLIQNPTGTNTDPARCHRILSLAEQYGFAIVEDDVYGDLHEGPAVRLAQIDGLRHVIYVGSFAKLIGPALRVGFIAADSSLIAPLVERKLLSTLHGSTLLESFVAEVLDGGRYRRHLEQVRARLARMRRDSQHALESAGIDFDGVSGNGIFLWGRLPEAVNMDELVRDASDRSILLAKGSLFSPGSSSDHWMRFNAAYSAAPELIRYLNASLPAAA